MLNEMPTHLFQKYLYHFVKRKTCLQFTIGENLEIEIEFPQNLSSKPNPQVD